MAYFLPEVSAYLEILIALERRLDAGEVPTMPDPNGSRDRRDVQRSLGFWCQEVFGKIHCVLEVPPGLPAVVTEIKPLYIAFHT